MSNDFDKRNKERNDFFGPTPPVNTSFERAHELAKQNRIDRSGPATMPPLRQNEVVVPPQLAWPMFNRK